ncbi:MAG: class I SAM-dependent methyltransferase [Calothrix sp. CSU_2_0]|nr:class I SAM-dependent methyltransferase [Calothrix sp. CSU_2_0]
MTKTKVELGVVQETLLITLWARATELLQPDPIICDRKSAEILAAIDYDFSKFSNSKNSQIGCCLRGLILDNWVRDYLQEYPQGIVVEIGAGLNTRFERVDNGTVRWFDLDLPDAIALRKQFFTETERCQIITSSCLDTDYLYQVKEIQKQLQFSDKPILFVAEGVLMYLSEQQVKLLFANLLQVFPGCRIAFDSMSSLMVKNQKRHDSLKHTSAKFDWSISNIRKIQEWDSRYQILEVCIFADLPAQYLRRYPYIQRFVFRYMPILRDSYRLSLLQLG